MDSFILKIWLNILKTIMIEILLSTVKVSIPFYHDMINTWLLNFIFLGGSILRGYHAMKVSAALCPNLRKPELLIATRLRKYMACITQVSYFVLKS